MSLAMKLGKVAAVVNSNSAEILTGLSIAGVILTGITAGNARLKADDILIELEEQHELDGLEPPQFTEKARATWWCYILPCIIGGATIAGFVGSHKIQGRKLAALASAYTLSDTAFAQYREKVKEKFGVKKADEVDLAISQDMATSTDLSDPTIINRDQGDVLCILKWNGVKFLSNKHKILTAVENVNNRLPGDLCISLNELNNELFLDDTDEGNILGWNIMFDGKGPKVKFDSCLDREGIPCLVVSFAEGHEPTANFNTF